MSSPASRPLRPTTVQDLIDLNGVTLGYSSWRLVDQEAIKAFADLSGDHQWIHVDQQRAAASSFGSTIGHGLLTLSFGPPMLEELMRFDGFAQALNYGYDKVRFPASLPVDTKVRMKAEILDVRPGESFANVSVQQTFEAEGQAKPVCVAVQVVRFNEQ